VGSNPTGPTINPHAPNSQLVNYGLFLRREGYRPSTIERHLRSLKSLPLHNPDLAKQQLADSDAAESTKEVVANSLAKYYAFLKIPFSKPIYRRVERNIFLPYEEEVVQLISELPRSKAAFCQLLRETGCRAGEAFQLKWTDLSNGVVSITPEKHSKPRQFQLSPKLLSMLNSLPKKGTRIWSANPHHFCDNFYRQRKAIAEKLGNPRVNGIHFHTFRHLKASREYHRTKDLVYVQRLLGHRSIATTLKYIQLQSFENEEFVCKMAKSLSEASSLIEAGFEYVTELDGVRLFRKRK